jgi:hypothetical protein
MIKLLHATLGISSGKVVEHLTFNPEIEGLNPVIGTGREQMKKNVFKILEGKLFLIVSARNSY